MKLVIHADMPTGYTMWQRTNEKAVQAIVSGPPGATINQERQGDVMLRHLYTVLH